MRPHPSPVNGGAGREGPFQARIIVEGQSRRDVDYPLLDSRIQQLMTKPAMVGMAVGVVENGRITFLKGYGETLAGSGDPVTPETVFRWASTSKGVAATMVTKLAEQGKIDLQAPVANYAPDLKLPAATNIGRRSATCCRTASASIATPTTTSWRKARTRACCAQACRSSTRPACRVPAGRTRTSLMTRRARWSVAVTRLPYEQAVKRMLFNPIGMTSGSVSMAGLESKPAGPDRTAQAAAVSRWSTPITRSRRRRHQQQHQGHGAVDGSADGRDARRARRKVLDTIHAP